MREIILQAALVLAGFIVLFTTIVACVLFGAYIDVKKAKMHFEMMQGFAAIEHCQPKE